MRQLTQDESERCRKACGWRFIPPSSNPLPENHNCWVNEHGQIINGLPLDPYFWFPRLWDRLCLTDCNPVIGFCDGENMATFSVGTSLRQVRAKHPCLALCAAIETLGGI